MAVPSPPGLAFGNATPEDAPIRSAVFAGCARDCAGELPTTIAAIERLAEAFDRYAVVMVENDSVDDTKRVLAGWAARNPRVHIINADGLGREKLSRTGRMAKARNLFLDWVQHQPPSLYRFMVVFDADGLLSSDPHLDALNESLEFLDAGHDRVAAFANSFPVYYDIWTLRHDLWCPTDCFYEFETQRSTIGDVAAIHRFVNDRQIPIPESSSPIEVRSAFGGLGIYKIEATRGARYSAASELGMDACEHVAFNAHIGKAGRMFIMPRLMVRAPLVHTITGSNRTKWLALHAHGNTAKLLVPDGNFPDSHRLSSPRSSDRFILLLKLLARLGTPGSLLDLNGGIGATAVFSRLSELEVPIVAYESSSFLFRHAKENQCRNPRLLRNVDFRWGSAITKVADIRSPFISAPVINLSNVIRVENPSSIRLRLDDFEHLSSESLDEIQNGYAVVCIDMMCDEKSLRNRWLEKRLQNRSMLDVHMLLLDEGGNRIIAGSGKRVGPIIPDLVDYIFSRRTEEHSKHAETAPILMLFPERQSHVVEIFCSLFDHRS